jgi:hypothetical protein
MARVVGATADAVAAGNGYQADPEASLAIWEKVRAAWVMNDNYNARPATTRIPDPI